MSGHNKRDKKSTSEIVEKSVLDLAAMAEMGEERSDEKRDGDGEEGTDSPRKDSLPMQRLVGGNCSPSHTIHSTAHKVQGGKVSVDIPRLGQKVQKPRLSKCGLANLLVGASDDKSLPLSSLGRNKTSVSKGIQGAGPSEAESTSAARNEARIERVAKRLNMPRLVGGLRPPSHTIPDLTADNVQGGKDSVDIPRGGISVNIRKRTRSRPPGKRVRGMRGAFSARDQLKRLMEGTHGFNIINGTKKMDGREKDRSQAGNLLHNGNRDWNMSGSEDGGRGLRAEDLMSIDDPESSAESRLTVEKCEEPEEELSSEFSLKHPQKTRETEQRKVPFQKEKPKKPKKVPSKYGPKRSEELLLTEEELKVPLNNGWVRFLVKRKNGRKAGDIYYQPPDRKAKKLRSSREVAKYLEENTLADLSPKRHFSFKHVPVDHNMQLFW